LYLLAQCLCFLDQYNLFVNVFFFFFSSRRRHTRSDRDWSSDVCSSDLVRALSRFHQDHPYEVQVNGNISRVQYEPAESVAGLFGGNSNWRGPIWFPVNYLLVESLQKFHHYYGEDFKVEFPTNAKRECDLWTVAAEISRHMV